MKSKITKLVSTLFVMGAVIGGASSAQAYWTNGYYYTGSGCCCSPCQRVVYVKKTCGCCHKWVRTTHYKKFYRVHHVCTSCGG